MSSGSRSAATRSNGPIGPVTDNRTVWCRGTAPAPRRGAGRAPVDGAREAELHGLGGTGAQLLDGVGDDDAALLDDGEPLDEPLDLVEVM